MHIPKIYISNLLNINSNSIANIKKVFQYLEKILGIQNKIRK
jgi:hypothetical protein